MVGEVAGDPLDHVQHGVSGSSRASILGQKQNYAQMFDYELPKGFRPLLWTNLEPNRNFHPTYHDFPGSLACVVIRLNKNS